MEEVNNIPPFEGLISLIRSSGYEVVSIGAEHSALRFTGAINLQIAPADVLKQTDFFSFPLISQDFLAKGRECAPQSHQQGNGNFSE